MADELDAGDVRDARVRHALAVLEAVIRCGEDLLGRSQRLAPIEEGTLRGSAELAIIVNGIRLAGAGAKGEAMILVRALAGRGELRTVDAEVAFTEIYAAAQHEGVKFVHPLGGQAKYLEQPLGEQARRYGRIIDLAGRRALG